MFIAAFIWHRSISIHAPRVGSDGYGLDWLSRNQISIHAPRVGSDKQVYAICVRDVDFNPRSPCGERRSPPVFVWLS